MTFAVVTLRVDNLFCVGCVNAVTAALEAVPETRDVTVNLKTGIATLSYNAETNHLLRAVEQIGKQATLISTTPITTTAITTPTAPIPVAPATTPATTPATPNPTTTATEFNPVTTVPHRR